jgi:hypothetical protein
MIDKSSGGRDRYLQAARTALQNYLLASGYTQDDAESVALQAVEGMFEIMDDYRVQRGAR